MRECRFMRDVPHGCQYGVRDIGFMQVASQVLSFIRRFSFLLPFSHQSTCKENNANFMGGFGAISFLKELQCRTNGFMRNRNCYCPEKK